MKINLNIKKLKTFVGHVSSYCVRKTKISCDQSKYNCILHFGYILNVSEQERHWLKYSVAKLIELCTFFLLIVMDLVLINYRKLCSSDFSLQSIIYFDLKNIYLHIFVYEVVHKTYTY